MNFLNKLSIAQKLRRMILLTSGGALLIASLVYIAIDLISYRQSMIDRTSVLAEFIAINTSASLVFEDEETANTLLRSLVTEKIITGATIFRENGELFSHFNVNERVKQEMVDDDRNLRDLIIK